MNENVFGAIVGSAVVSYGAAYLVAQGLHALHRRKVELQNAKALLEWQFNNGPAQWETYGNTKAFPSYTSHNQARVKANVAVHSQDWTGRP